MSRKAQRPSFLNHPKCHCWDYWRAFRRPFHQTWDSQYLAQPFPTKCGLAQWRDSLILDPCKISMWPHRVIRFCIESIRTLCSEGQLRIRSSICTGLLLKVLPSDLVLQRDRDGLTQPTATFGH